MRDNRDNALGITREIPQQFRDLRSIGGIETGGGFVCEHDDGVMGNGARNRDALFLTMRQLVGS